MTSPLSVTVALNVFREDQKLLTLQTSITLVLTRTSQSQSCHSAHVIGRERRAPERERERGREPRRERGLF